MFPIIGFSQINISWNDDPGISYNGDTIFVARSTNSFDVIMYCKNTSGSPLDIKFSRVIISNSVSFSEQFADNNLVYSVFSNLWTTPILTTLQSGDSSLMRPSYYFQNQGSAHLRYYVLDFNNVKLDSVDVNISPCTITYSNLNAQVCDSYITPSGEILISTGMYTDTISNSGGCDSIFSIDLTIIGNSSSSNLTQSSCGNFTYNGQTYYNSGVFSQLLTNSVGCDSLITLDLTINSNQFNTDFIVNQTLFTAPPFAAQFANNTPNHTNYNFTWDFGDGTILQSNNANVFHEYQYNGLYDVTLIAENIVTGCTDTMLKTDNIYCTGGPGLSIVEVSSQLNIFPNPTNENITISIENFNGNIQTEVYDLIGNRLQSTNETTISLRDYARGIYIFKVAYGDRVEEIKVIKN